ncbi:MAG: protein phosphatase 2C domain-containing protein [Streptosporangiales bacterium]|nr:protein phosphatase 2C domain-containing protein [Streptosporangiales bacterium]
MTLALRYAVRSDVGLLREGNEDSAYAGPHLLAVADGMGGHAAGEVASAATITTMAALDNDRVGGDLAGALADQLASANHRLQELIRSDPATEGMGTTLTAILWAEGHAALCHIGDSRAYLLRDGQFYQITHDHTLVQSLVDEGKITEDDVATHPHRSLLLRALDGRTVAEPDLSVHETMPGDRYMLCSDGLSGVVTEQTLHQTLRSAREPDEAAMQLIELAIKGGGPDNITCIVADVIDGTAGAATRGSSFAGAAANGAPTTGPQKNGPADAQRPSSPATRARNLARTSPQPKLDEDWQQNGNGDQAGYGDSSFQGQNGPPGGYDGSAPVRGKRRRRFPIMTGVLVLVVVVVVGAVVYAYQYSQSQYYIGPQAGNVAIFRGLAQPVAGINLHSLDQASALPLKELSSAEQAQVNQTINYTSKQKAQAVLQQLQQQTTECQQDYKALAAWQTKNAQYQAYMAKWNKLNAQQKKVVPKAASPGPQPASPSLDCAPSSAFDISSAALPTPGGASPAASPAPSPSAAPKTPATAPAAPSPGKSA